MQSAGRVWLAVTLGVLCLLSQESAHANGRFPSAQQLVFSPRDPNRLWLRATHGLLTSADRGANWHWICEEGLGYRGIVDPAIAVDAAGTLLVAIPGGLMRSRDNGCNFPVEPTIGEQFVADVSVDKKDPTRALVLTSTGDGMGSYINEVWRTLDSGASWRQLGQDLDLNFVGTTIDSAPSDARSELPSDPP